MATKHPRMLRLDDECEAIVQSWQEHFNRDRPGQPISVSEVIRTLIVKVGYPSKSKKGPR